MASAGAAGPDACQSPPLVNVGSLLNVETELVRMISSLDSVPAPAVAFSALSPCAPRWATISAASRLGTQPPAKCSMHMQIEGKLKTALDESRLLILGAQVLFGFQFEAVFQDLFADIPVSSRYVHCAGLVMLLASIALLIAPSLFHQIIFGGESRPGAVIMATTLAGASLLPLTFGLGAVIFVTFEQLFNRDAGVAAGASFTAIALALLYGLGVALRRERRTSMPDQQTDTSLKSKIEQMLTGARSLSPAARRYSASS